MDVQQIAAEMPDEQLVSTVEQWMQSPTTSLSVACVRRYILTGKRALCGRAPQMTQHQRHARILLGCLLFAVVLCTPKQPCAAERTITAEPVPTATGYELERKAKTSATWIVVGQGTEPTFRYSAPAKRETDFRICAVRGTEKACPTFWVTVKEP